MDPKNDFFSLGSMGCVVSPLLFASVTELEFKKMYENISLSINLLENLLNNSSINECVMSEYL